VSYYVKYEIGDDVRRFYGGKRQKLIFLNMGNPILGGSMTGPRLEEPQTIFGT